MVCNLNGFDFWPRTFGNCCYKFSLFGSFSSWPPCLHSLMTIFSLRNLSLICFTSDTFMVKRVSVPVFLYSHAPLSSPRQYSCKALGFSCYRTELIDLDGIGHSFDRIQSNRSFAHFSYLEILVFFMVMHKFIHNRVFRLFLKESMKISFQKLHFSA